MRVNWYKQPNPKKIINVYACKYIRGVRYFTQKNTSIDRERERESHLNLKKEFVVRLVSIPWMCTIFFSFFFSEILLLRFESRRKVVPWCVDVEVEREREGEGEGMVERERRRGIGNWRKTCGMRGETLWILVPNLFAQHIYKAFKQIPNPWKLTASGSTRISRITDLQKIYRITNSQEFDKISWITNQWLLVSQFCCLLFFFFAKLVGSI